MASGIKRKASLKKKRRGLMNNLSQIKRKQSTASDPAQKGHNSTKKSDREREGYSKQNRIRMFLHHSYSNSSTNCSRSRCIRITFKTLVRENTGALSPHTCKVFGKSNLFSMTERSARSVSRSRHNLNRD